MTHDSHGFPPMFRIDVSADPAVDSSSKVDTNEVIVALLRHLVTSQDRQCKLLEDISQQLGQAQKQRAAELGQWREANPHLARGCRLAAETLSRVQTQFLQNLTDEIADQEDSLMDGEFMLNEFVDRYGPRLAHMNGVLQVLSQLSSVPQTSNP